MKPLRMRRVGKNQLIALLWRSDLVEVNLLVRVAADQFFPGAGASYRL